MSNPTIRVKRSSVQGKVPSPEQITRGELAINSFDGKIFILKDQYSVGIATTTVTVNPWNETEVGAGISYSGTVTAESFVGDGSGLTNVSTVPLDVTEEYFTATKTLPAYIQVFVNGVKIRSADYSKSSSTLTLSTPCNSGDEVDIALFG